MENNIDSYFQKASSILIVLPQKPSFDQVAAGLSLYLSLSSKKQVSVICPDPMLVEFNALVGVDKVTQKAEEKNLIIHFAGYDAAGVEKVSSDLKNGELYLTLIPQPGVKPPSKEQIKLFYDGTSCDLIILVGGTDESQFPILSGSPDVSAIDKIHIGLHEIHQTRNNNIIPYVRSSSSVSELAADLIRALGLEIDADIASNLIAGIEVGSNNYSSEGTTADTFQTIADLLRIGGRRVTPYFKTTTTSRRFGKFSGKLVAEDYPGQGIQSGSVLQSLSQEQEDVKLQESPPSDWLAPKIFKGTSTS